MMTLEEIQQLADEKGVDISNSILGLPIKEQMEIAKRDGITDYRAYVIEFLEDALQIQKDSENARTLTAREALDEVPPNERFSYAAYLGRVYGNDMSAIEVLKIAEYTDDEIAEFERLNR